MRLEQIIAAVTRQVVITTVREIKAVVRFVEDVVRLHLSRQRMPLGMPAYSGSSHAWSPQGVGACWMNTDEAGNKRGRLPIGRCLPLLASCPAESSRS